MGGYTVLVVSLAGESVVLRPPAEKYVAAVREIFRDPQTMEHLKFMAPRRGWTAEQVRRRFRRQNLAGRKGESRQFIVVAKDGNRPVGTCGFNTINRDDAMYALLEVDWPAAKKSLEKKLAWYGGRRER